MCQSTELDIDVGNAWDLIREVSPSNLDRDTSYTKFFFPRLCIYIIFKARGHDSHTRARTHTHAHTHTIDT
jgi:hypothetical protein